MSIYTDPVIKSRIDARVAAIEAQRQHKADDTAILLEMRELLEEIREILKVKP